MSNPPPQSDQSLSTDNLEHSSPDGRKKLLITVVVVLIAITVFAALYGWRFWRNADSGWSERPPVAVSAMQLTPTDVPVSITAVGSLRAAREVVLAPETEGRVIDIRFEAGQTVEAGSLLVQLYDAPQRADRAAAIARADLAKAQLARSRTLIDTGAASRESLDERIAERDQALAAVKQLDARIEQKQIRAPFTGKLGIRQINLGQYLSPGEPIVTLTDTSQLFVDFSVPQQELRWLREGSTVRVKSDAWPEREFIATVDTIEPRVSSSTRNIEVRGLLPNPGNMLRPGMFVDTELALPSEPNQLVVPSTAIQTTAFGDNVLVIRGSDPMSGGKAEYVRVTTGRRLGNQVVIHDGLQAGDVIITEGQLRVRPDAEVQVAQQQTTVEP